MTYDQELSAWLAARGCASIREAQGIPIDETSSVFDSDAGMISHEVERVRDTCRLLPFGYCDDPDFPDIGIYLPWSKVQSWVAEHGKVIPATEIDFLDSMNPHELKATKDLRAMFSSMEGAE